MVPKNGYKKENRHGCSMRRLRSHNPLFLQDSLVAKISSPFSFVSFFPRLRLRSGVFSVSFCLCKRTKKKKAGKQKRKRIYGKGRGWGFKSRPQLGPVLSAKDVSQELRPLRPHAPYEKSLTTRHLTSPPSKTSFSHTFDNFYTNTYPSHLRIHPHTQTLYLFFHSFAHT